MAVSTQENRPDKLVQMARTVIEAGVAEGDIRTILFRLKYARRDRPSTDQLNLTAGAEAPSL